MAPAAAANSLAGCQEQSDQVGCPNPPAVAGLVRHCEERHGRLLPARGSSEAAEFGLKDQSVEEEAAGNDGRAKWVVGRL